MAIYKFRRIKTHATALHKHLSQASIVSITVKHNQVMQHLLIACPSFRRPWKEFTKKTHTRLVYVMLAEFSEHLFNLYKSGNINELPAVASAIEYLYIHGNPYVKDALTKGLLEATKSIWIRNNLDPELFADYLKPLSTAYWQGMNTLWDD